MLRSIEDKFKNLLMVIKFQEKKRRNIKQDNGSELPRIEDSSQVEGVHQDLSGKRKIHHT